MIKFAWKVICIICFTLIFIGLPSCEEQAPRLRSPERKIIDSLYSYRIKTLKKELDSICQLSRQERIDFAVDSIMALRLVERKKRLGY